MKHWRHFALILMVFCTFLSLALADGNNPTDEVKIVNEGLFMENFAKAKAEMITFYAKKDPKLAEILKGKNIDKAFVSKHLESDLKTVVLDLLAPEITSGKVKASTFEKVPFQAYKAFDQGTKLATVAPTNLPSTTNAFDPKVRNGYSSDILKIDPNAPHTFGETDGYINDRLTKTALERIKNSNSKVEIHAGGDPETFQSLKNRGYEIVGEVRSALSRYERVYMAKNPATGEVRYAITGLSGADRVFHIESMLRMAKVDGSKVSVVGDPNTIKETNYSELRKGFETSAIDGDKAMIGFRNEVKKELLDRAIYSRRHEYIKDNLGTNPREKLIENLKAEAAKTTDVKVKASIDKAITSLSKTKTYDGLFNMDSKEVFKKSANSEKMKNFEGYLTKLASEHPGIKSLSTVVKDGAIPLPGGIDIAKVEAARNISNNVLNMDEYVIKTRNGKTESFKVVANYYGDTMGDVGRALIDSGVKKIGYMGTAGGVTSPNSPVKVGDVHIPKSIYDPAGNLANGGIENAFLKDLKPTNLDSYIKDRVKMGTNLGNVRSPMVESNAWLKDVANRGLNSVEVETSHLSRAVNEAAKARGVQPELYTSVIISDVPGSEETLDKLNPAKRKKSFSRMLDQYLDVMGIEDVALREKVASTDKINPTFVDNSTDKAYKLAEKLLPKKLKEHVVMREHIARTLMDNMGKSAIDAIDLSKKIDLEKLPLSDAVKSNLRDRISNPYTDKVLVRSVETANSKLSYLAKALETGANGRSYDLKLLGDLAKGTFGANSEVRFSVDGADPQFKELIKSEVAKLNGGKGPKLTFVENPGGEAALSVKGGTGFLKEANYLSRLNADKLYERSGLILRNDWAGRPVLEYDDLRRTGGRAPNMLDALTEAGLYANYEAAMESPDVSVNSDKFKKFKSKLEKYGATIEFVDPASDPRWEPGASGKTIVDADGKIKVLLPKGKTVKSLALMEELTHTIDLQKMINANGKEYVAGLFEKAKGGDKQARAKLLDMEARAKKIALLNMDNKNPLKEGVKKELRKINTELDKMYDKTKDFKKLIEAEDYYSLGRKMEDIVRERGIMKKADADLKRYINDTVEILKHGDPTPESAKVTLVRGVKNDKVWGESTGRPFMLTNRVNHGRTAWDSRLGGGMERYFTEATARSWSNGSHGPDANPKKVFDFESMIYDHASSTNNSKMSMFISSSGTAKTIWGPPFYVLRVSPKRAIFNYKSPFPGEAEVLLPFFVLPNEVHRKYTSFNEAINDPYVKKSPYYKMATEGGSYYSGNGNITEKWKKINDNIKNGREPLEGIEGLNSRFETYNVGPNAADPMIEKFKAKLTKYGAEIEWVKSNDSRLAKDGQARTYVTADGKVKVLLPKDKPVKKFALIDEFTHVLQINNMAKKYGKETVAEIFKAAATGDPMAKTLLLQWEIKAKENILLTLDKNDADRKLVKESLEKLKREADPLYGARKTNGLLDWKKVKDGLKSGALGIAHFGLSLFLKELAVAVQTNDRFVIEEFFSGLMSVDFYTEYGLFSAGAMGGEFIYTKFLERYIKPKFVNTVLKSTLVMAAGMALPELIHGRFDGKAFAINLSGMFLSSSAVKAGVAGLKWVLPIEKLATQATWMKKLMSAYNASKWAKVGGWFYTAAETAVVLYFGDKISRAITNYLDEKEAKSKVGEATEAFIEAVKTGNKAKIEEAMKNLEEAYGAYRNFLYKPLEEEEQKLMMRLNNMGRELKGLQDAYDRYMKLYESDPAKYASLKRMAENLKSGKIAGIEKDMKDAFAIYERNRDAKMKEIYQSNIRNTPLVGNDMETIDALMGRTGSGVGGILDRGTNWWKARSVRSAFSNPSNNRMESYVDEADVINLAMAMNSNKEVREMLRLRMDELGILAETDKVLFEASSGATGSTANTTGGTRINIPSNSEDTDGLLKRLHGMGNK